MIRRNLIGVVLWMVILVVLVGSNLAAASAQSPNQVGLVVGLGDGSVITRCIKFNEAEISGYDVLMRSGLQFVAAPSGGMGLTVCLIEDQGCPANNCFCRCSGSTCTYWSYWHFDGGEWSYSSAGADSYRARPGDVEGWVWGTGDPPPVVPMEQICAPPATATPPPTLTPAPTDTPVPTVAPTLPPTSTPAAPLPTGTTQLAETPTQPPSATPVPPTETPTPPPSATPTETTTVVPSTTTTAPTPTPQSMAGQLATPSMTPTEGAAPLPSPTLKRHQVTPTPHRQGDQGMANYVLFGVLLAVLVGGMFVILFRRKR